MFRPRALATLAVGVLLSTAPVMMQRPAESLPAAPAAFPALSRTPYGPGFVDLGLTIPRLPDLAGNTDAVPQDSAVLGNRLVFAGNGPAGVEPWITDGTPGGTRMIRDLYPGRDTSRSRYFVSYRGKVYFQSSGSTGDAELWSTDGTARGTVLVADLDRTTSSYPAGFVVHGDRLYFTAVTDDGKRRLWTYTPEDGARVAADLGASSNVADLTPYGAGMAFSGRTPDGGARFVHHLYYYSGGSSGSTRRLDVEDLATDLSPQALTSIGSRIVLRAGNGASGGEIWRIAGSPGLAEGIKDVWPGAESSDPQRFVRLGDAALFTATTPAEGNELWTTDGTAGGTQMLRDIRPSLTTEGPRNLLRVGGTVYFLANDDSHGYELWQTRGSVSSTRMVRDLAPGATGSVPVPLAGVGRRVLVSAEPGAAGREPWVLDPVSGSLRMIAELTVGPGDTELEPVGVIGSTVIVAAASGTQVRLLAYTATPSVTRPVPARSYARTAGRHRTIRVPVRVTGDGRAVPGVVRLYRGSRVVGRAVVVGGVARVRITVPLGPGRHVLRASYGGSIHAQSSRSATFTVRVR